MLPRQAHGGSSRTDQIAFVRKWSDKQNIGLWYIDTQGNDVSELVYNNTMDKTQ